MLVYILDSHKMLAKPVMKICRCGNQNANGSEFISVSNNENIEIVKEFVYLGFLTADNYDASKEIRRLH